jgi:hypothetical protein
MARMMAIAPSQTAASLVSSPPPVGSATAVEDVGGGGGSTTSIDRAGPVESRLPPFSRISCTLQSTVPSSFGVASSVSSTDCPASISPPR